MSDPRLERPLWRGRTNVDALMASCVEHAEQIVRDERPDIAHDFIVTKGGYQNDDGTTTSGNTHRLGGPLDLDWCGHEFCLLALRRAGMFIWHRKTLIRNGVVIWRDHFHGGPIGHPFMDPSAEAQERDYLNRRNGLSDHGPDDGPRLNPIPRPVWPWPPDWTDMATKEELAGVVADQIRAAIPIIVEAVLAAQVDDDPVFNVKTALRRAGQPKEEN